jgi:dihydrodipicolinate synthase/N-acetylneuraminate lyase
MAVAWSTFEGVVAPLFSPLDRRERIVERDLVKLVRYLLARGIHGFLAPSGTGEFFALSAEERRRTVEIVAGEAGGKVPVIAIAGACGTRESLAHAAAARRAGADAVMATPPYYAPVDQRGLVDFFRALAEDGGLPVWLYHQPGETKLTIEPDTVAELARVPGVVGIKVSAGADLLYYHRVVRRLREQPAFRVLMGEDFNCLGAFALGGHGAVATLANILPEEFVGLWKAVKGGDLATARLLQDRIMDAQELLVFVRAGCMQSAAKLVLERRRLFRSARCTAPLPALPPGERARVEAGARALRLF